MPRPRYRNIHTDPIPTTDNIRWRRWSKPLLALLQQPRTWEDIEAWRLQEGPDDALLKNCLAWLDNEGLVMPSLKDGKVVWVAMAKEIPPAPRKPRRKKAKPAPSPAPGPLPPWTDDLTERTLFGF